MKEAFSGFLTILRFPKEEDLNSLFSCWKCEMEGACESGTMYAVVMDGTTLGILGTLPEFERSSLTVPAVQRIPRLQYIMKVPRARGFIDDLLLSARSGIEEVEFSVALKRKLHPHQTALIRKFFVDSPDDEEEYVFACFTALLRNIII